MKTFHVIPLYRHVWFNMEIMLSPRNRKVKIDTPERGASLILPDPQG